MSVKRILPSAGGLSAVAAACLTLHCAACLAPAPSATDEPPPGAEPRYTEDRQPCVDRNPWRNLYFGDLHAHTALSFDAAAYGTTATPDEAWGFARGVPIGLPGGGPEAPREAVPEGRLDFAALTDHSEYLGEVLRCSTKDSGVFETATCSDWRTLGESGVVAFGVVLAGADPVRMADVCAPVEEVCREVARGVWAGVVAAAERANDRTPSCRFSAFPAYEYTSSLEVTNLHRNVIFRNSSVPDLPLTVFEAPLPWDLIRGIAERCTDAGGRCDALSIPHNSNWSNGRLFEPAYPGAASIDEERAMAALRARIEPLAEVFQHKGDMECDPAFAQAAGAPDPECDFEKQRLQPFEDCGDGTGIGGVSRMGCVSRRDFLRGVLDAGLREQVRLGRNPFAIGVLGSTDTHNGTPGFVEEDRFMGHVGTTDDTVADRLGPGNLTHHGVVYNPGGLAAVWAVENSRDAIFEALRRREVYGTSGPRIEVRTFTGFDLPEGICSDPDRVKAGYAAGVPMGGDLGKPPSPGARPALVAWAVADPGREGRPGAALSRIQVVTGRVGPDGRVIERVADVATAPGAGGETIDLGTCAPPAGQGAAELCGRWEDDAFDPAAPAYWYVRVLLVPTCRWSVRQCGSLPAAERPESCADPAFRRAIRERAWTSPVFYTP